MFFRVFSCVMALLLLSMPLLVIAQETSDAAQAMVDAKNDVKDPVGWLAGTFLTAVGLGCLGGSVVLLVSQVISPSPLKAMEMGEC